MECYHCGALLTETDFCTACGSDVGKYKKIMYAANRYYNDGLERASVRDLSGAMASLKQCLKLNKGHVDARNLMGLIYFEMGEAVAGMSEWVVSKNIRADKNIADDFLEKIQSNQSRLETITSTIKKYNKALELCEQGSNDLAVIQLKKVLSMNPKYVQAHRLLALLYIERAEYEKASKELDKCMEIDRGDIDALRYRKEVDLVLDSLDESRKKSKTRTGIFEEKTSKTFVSGNEVIIQPLTDKEPRGIAVFIEVMLGILIGVCATYFLIVPAQVKKAQSEASAEVNTYGETIDKKNAEITELENRVSQLELDNISLLDTVETYEGTNGAVDANNYLISAAQAYIANPEDSIKIEGYLDLIGQDYVDQTASFEFREMYDFLMASVGANVADSYYESGLSAYNQLDYVSAVKDLTKAVRYNPNSDSALYYLAIAYYESGDLAQASDKLNQLLVAFPSSEFGDKARQRLQEMSAD